MPGSLNRATVRLTGIDPRLGLERLLRVGGGVVRVAPQRPGRRGRNASPSWDCCCRTSGPSRRDAGRTGSGRSRPRTRRCRAGTGSRGRWIARRLAGLERADRAAAVAVGAVDPAVEAQLEAVEPVLLVALDEAGEEDLAMVGLAVAVAVLGVEDVRGARDQDALAPGHDAGREAESVEEGRLPCRSGRRRRCLRGTGPRRRASPCRRCPAGSRPSRRPRACRRLPTRRRSGP